MLRKIKEFISSLLKKFPRAIHDLYLFEDSFYKYLLPFDKYNRPTKILYQNINNLQMHHEKKDPSDNEFRFNSDLFRCDDFKENSAESIFVGCSETAGMGGTPEEAWGHMVYKKMSDEKNFVNLGLSGGGWSACLYNIYFYIHKYGKPKNIFILFPNIERRILFGYPPTHKRKKYSWRKIKIKVNKKLPVNFYSWWFPMSDFTGFKYSRKHKLDEHQFQTLFKQRCDEITILTKVCEMLNINLIWGVTHFPDSEIFRDLNENAYHEGKRWPGLTFFDNYYYRQEYYNKAVTAGNGKAKDKYDGHQPIIWHEYVADVMYSKWLELNDNSRN